MPFKVTLDGKTYDTNSLTLDESDQLEEACGRTWLELNPVRSSKEFRAIARVFLARDHSPVDVDRVVAGVTIGAAMASVEWADDDLPDLYEDGIPKAEGEPLTTTSSGSPTPRSDGHPTSPAGNGSATSVSSTPPASRKT